MREEEKAEGCAPVRQEAAADSFPKTLRWQNEAARNCVTLENFLKAPSGMDEYKRGGRAGRGRQRPTRPVNGCASRQTKLYRPSYLRLTTSIADAFALLRPMISISQRIQSMKSMMPVAQGLKDFARALRVYFLAVYGSPEFKYERAF